MRARDAIQLTFDAFDAFDASDAFDPAEVVFVCANGYISREAFALRDTPRAFYMLGSMGLASSIALGVALAKPELKVVALDGDGNLLMGLGALALIGAQQPPNLFHVCIDNGVYASTGNQPSVARQVCLEGIAREAGYRFAERAETRAEAGQQLAILADQPGPGFLRLIVAPESHPRTLGRVGFDCEQIHARFAQALRGEA